jgi:hypothetical protein
LKYIPGTVVLAALGFALSVSMAPALAADVGVSVSIGEPNFYGRIDIGDYPAPRVVYRQPVMVVEQGRVEARRSPVYLRVPPGHRRHWSKNCARYDACGQQVYFVDDRWYNDVYAPQYRERHGHGEHGHHRHHGDDRDDHGGDRDGRDHEHDGDRHHG